MCLAQSHRVANMTVSWSCVFMDRQHNKESFRSKSWLLACNSLSRTAVEKVTTSLHKMHIKCQGTVNSDAKNMASEVFFKSNRHVETSGPLDYFGKQCGVIWCFFYVCLFVFFYVWILVTIQCNCLGDDCNVFSLWNSSSFVSKKFHPTFHRHEGE